MKYDAFIKSIQTQLQKVEGGSKDETRRREILQESWNIGHNIFGYMHETGTSAQQIAIDLGFPKQALQRYVRFYKVFPDGYKNSYGNGQQLSWWHYDTVLYVNDDQAREFYLKEASEQNWSTSQTRLRVRDHYYENNQQVKASTKTKGLKVNDGLLYMYTADVLKVVDGDTLLLNIDVGFKAKLEHKVRLRGINCAERKTKKGEQARQFVIDTLEQCRPRLVSEAEAEPYPLIAIRSYNAGKFGRYIVDVFYKPGETDKQRIASEGFFLNQVLLDKGLADSF